MESTTLTGVLISAIQFIQTFTQALVNNPDISGFSKILLFAMYTSGFAVLVFTGFLMAKYILDFIAQGIRGAFLYLVKGRQDDPEGLPNIVAFTYLKAIPWHSIVLLTVLVFCGTAALVTELSLWGDAFKYLLGALLGSFMGTVLSPSTPRELGPGPLNSPLRRRESPLERAFRTDAPAPKSPSGPQAAAELYEEAPDYDKDVIYFNAKASQTQENYPEDYPESIA